MKVNVVGDLLKDNVMIKTQAISGTTPIVSDVALINNLDGCSFQLITTGTVAGSWKIEVSNDYSSNTLPALGQAASTGTWSDVTASFLPAAPVPAGSATNGYTQMHPLVAKAVRITFTPSSGSGNVTALYFAKGNR